MNKIEQMGVEADAASKIKLERTFQYSPKALRRELQNIVFFSKRAKW